MQELEYKFLVSKEQFRDLLHRTKKIFGKPAEKVQINYYYQKLIKLIILMIAVVNNFKRELFFIFSLNTDTPSNNTDN